MLTAAINRSGNSSPPISLELVPRVTHATGIEHQTLTTEILALVHSGREIKLDPRQEISRFVKLQKDRLFRRLPLDKGTVHRIKNFLEDHYGPLDKGRLKELFSLFPVFAEQEGMRLLSQFLVRLSDPEQTRIVTVESISRQLITAFDNFGMFQGFTRSLASFGVSESAIAGCMELWGRILTARPLSDGSTLRVTHDPADWVASGRVPVATCQRLNKYSTIVDGNWNKQFGKSSNADGRPIARMLLPQCKLAQLIRESKVQMRALLELTVDETGELALLVERFYGSDERDISIFRAGILAFCNELGISEQRVFFAADRCSGPSPRRYPAPLPEEFRLYRDTFRPADFTTSPRVTRPRTSGRRTDTE